MAAAQETDRLLNRVFAGSYTQASADDMLRALSSQLNRLERTIRSQ
jgi:hypothetical protein